MRLVYFLLTLPRFGQTFVIKQTLNVYMRAKYLKI